MRSRMLHRRVVGLAAGIGLTGSAAAAQTLPDSVPYVPTPMPVVERMLGLAEVRPGDVVYDLGSGDGRIVITAAQRFGARGVGLEINPRLVRLGQANARTAGVDTLVEFVYQDLFTADLRPASVVMLYLSPEVNLRLRPKLLRELAPGARVVSHTFHMGDWTADRVAEVGAGFEGATVYLWMVPANVDGFWRLEMAAPQGEQSFVLEFEQRYQRLRGAARQGDRVLPLEDGRLAGERLTFVLRERAGRRVVTHHFTGILRDGELQGTYMSSDRDQPLAWRAARFTR